MEDFICDFNDAKGRNKAGVVHFDLVPCNDVLCTVYVTGGKDYNRMM